MIETLGVYHRFPKKVRTHPVAPPVAEVLHDHIRSHHLTAVSRWHHGVVWVLKALGP